tara:strand:+ start:93 stop:479 length:387 start_codon:yes stop_codon:yes gene_type:complete
MSKLFNINHLINKSHIRAFNIVGLPLLVNTLELDIEYPKNPKDGVYIEHKNNRFVTLYNCVIDNYGIYKVREDYSNMYWNPPEKYIYPEINWEEIWKEMDYCLYGYMRSYEYSISGNGPEIHFYNFKL